VRADGNVGIGTSAPSGVLNIQADDFGEMLLRIRNSDGDDSFIVDTDGDNDAFFTMEDKTGTQTIQLSTAANSYLNGGNVGIGTTAPQAKLDVLGTASSTDLWVGGGTATVTEQLVVGSPTGGGQGTGSINVSGDIYKNGAAYANPDYVFDWYYDGENDSGYQGLMSLADLEQYLRTNHHLPGISRETSGAFERMDMLLEKVEEQTLYILELNANLSQINHELFANNNVNNSTNTTTDGFLEVAPPLSAEERPLDGPMSRLDDLELRVATLEMQMTELNVGLGTEAESGEDANPSQIDHELDANSNANEGGEVVTDPDTNVTVVVDDNSQAANTEIIVTQDSTFYGTMTVIGETGFEAKVTFKNQVYFNQDTAGTALIPAGATSTEVVFGKEYEVVPQVTVTAERAIALGVVDKTIAGFRVIVAQPQEFDIMFDWIAIATSLKQENNKTLKQTGSKPLNHPPVVESLTQDRISSDLGEYVNLWVQATDPEGDSLTYNWESSSEGGYFEDNSQNLVKWFLPAVSQPISAVIKVTISDGINSVLASTTVMVYPSSSPENNTATGTTTEPENNMMTENTETADNIQTANVGAIVAGSESVDENVNASADSGAAAANNASADESTSANADANVVSTDNTNTIDTSDSESNPNSESSPNTDQEVLTDKASESNSNPEVVASEDDQLMTPSSASEQASADKENPESETVVGEQEGVGGPDEVNE
jgi:uncharacterized coiled-coil protein SlyX